MAGMLKIASTYTFCDPNEYSFHYSNQYSNPIEYSNEYWNADFYSYANKYSATTISILGK